MSCVTPPIVGVWEGVNKVVVCIAPSRDVQKSSDLMTLTPLLMNITQSSSNVRCQLGDGAPSNGQPNIKRQKLDEGANTVAVGSSASVAISVDDMAKDDDDDDGIKIVEDEDDNNDDVPVITVNAEGDSTTSTPSTANISNASTFPPFALMDLHTDVVADIKGKNHKRILNQLWWQYYNLDATWVKHLQLPQAPYSNQNIDDMMEHMLQEWRSNKYMQQCNFSMASIWAGTEGKFSTQFKNIMEHAHSSKKFQLSRDRHEKEFDFDFIFHCFFNTNGKAFPNTYNHILRVMCGLAALYEAGALGLCKVQLSNGSNMEYMFYPHCGYFTNNALMMNMHFVFIK